MTVFSTWSDKLLYELSDTLFKAWYVRNHMINFIQCETPEGSHMGRGGKRGKEEEREHSLLMIKLLFLPASTCFLLDL